MKIQVEFQLMKSEDRWLWSVFLPTQRNRFRDRVSAEQAMAKVVNDIMTKKFIVIEHDLTAGPARNYMGGISQLLRQYVRRDDTPKIAKGVKKKPASKSKNTVRRTAKRATDKKLPPVREKSSRPVRKRKVSR